MTGIAIQRVRRLGVISLLLNAVLATALHAELNLSPQRQEFDLEGVTMEQLVFDTGEAQKASYQPPVGWLYHGKGDRLDLQPPGKSRAQAAVIRTTTKQPLGFEQENRKKFAEAVVQSLPPESENVKIEAEENNPLKIDGHETYLIHVSYTYSRERFSRLWILLNRSNEQLRFQLTCADRDYTELARSFQKSLYSWRHL
jgi:hypothetical protein